MRGVRIFTVFLFLISLAAVALADEAGMKKDAQEAARNWLAQIDAGKYGESYDTAAPIFKAALSRADWEKALQSARAPLGKTASRTMAASTYTTTLPGAPDGKYVVMQFDSDFANKKRAVETITMMMGDDGKWRSIGYFIK